MFEVISRAQPGELCPDTRKAVINADLSLLRRAIRQLDPFLPEMSNVQRHQMRLEYADAIHRLDVYEDQLAAVKRITEARARLDCPNATACAASVGVRCGCVAELRAAESVPA